MSLREEPVPFLFLDKDNKFQIGEEAAKIVSQIKGKIAVVAIAGLYRTGKSFILNRLLGRQEGFEIGATTNSCTKGIYIWGQPVKIQNENNTELNVILIDTEGIGSLEKDQTHDAKIFSLAVLISSFFIYNSMGVIDESALEKISFIAQLTKHIHIHSGTQEAEDQNVRELAPYFPSFLWLLRDFGLKLVDPDNNPITSREYLEQALTRLSKDKSKNEIRQVITSVFVNRDCVTLVRPVVDEEELQNLDKIPYDNLRDKFRTEVETLTKKIFGRVRPKYVFGEAINGAAYVTLVKNYVEAINSGAVPTIRSAWENVSELENKKAVDAAVEAFIKYFEEQVFPQFPLEFSDLKAQQNVATEKARETFLLGALGENKQDYLVQLEKRISDEFDKFSARNDLASEALCKQLLSEIYSKIDSALKAEEYSGLPELGRAWKQLVDNHYLPSARGRYKYSLLSEGLLARMHDSMISLDQSLLDKLRAAHEKERENLHAQLNDEREERRKQREEFHEIREDLRTQIDGNNKTITALQEAQEQSKARISDLQRDNERLEKELSDLRANPKKEVVYMEKEVIKEVPQSNDNAGKQKQKGKCVIQATLVRSQAAEKEHAALEIIRSYGKDVIHLPRSDDTKLNSVYTHEPALFLPSGNAVILNPSTRKPEAPAMLQCLNSLHWKIIGHLGPDAHCDGGDLMWIDEKTVVVGRTKRTNKKAVQELQVILDPLSIQVVEVHMPFQIGHLHSVVSILDKDLAVGYKDVLPVPLLELFQEKNIKLIEVPKEEYPTGASNVLILKPREVVLIQGNPVTKSKMEECGCKVMEWKADQLGASAGAGPKCLANGLLYTHNLSSSCNSPQ